MPLVPSMIVTFIALEHRLKVPTAVSDESIAKRTMREFQYFASNFSKRCCTTIRVNISGEGVLQPMANGNEHYEPQVAGSDLLVGRGQAAVLLELADAAFHEVTLPVVFDRYLAVVPARPAAHRRPDLRSEARATTVRWYRSGCAAWCSSCTGSSPEPSPSRRPEPLLC